MMSAPAAFPMDDRPDYGFVEFDRLMQHLRDRIPHVGTRADVLAALQLEGRDLDGEQLADELHLNPDLVEVMEQLAAFGDQGHWVHSFGSVHIAQVTAGSDGMCSLTTYVLATREGGSIEYSWEDENGGQGDLGVRDQPLTMVEMIAMVDAVMLAQEGFARGDWRDAYLGDEAMTVQLRSDFYPDLARWYETTIAEWRAAHPVEE